MPIIFTGGGMDFDDVAEWLETYGWVILTILAIVGALTYFGVIGVGSNDDPPPGVSEQLESENVKEKIIKPTSQGTQGNNTSIPNGQISDVLRRNPLLNLMMDNIVTFAILMMFIMIVTKLFGRRMFRW